MNNTWFIYALMSAFFAALTAILAKIGISERDNPFIGPQAVENAAYLKTRLNTLAKEANVGIEEIRGQHFFLGIKLAKDLDNMKVIGALRKNGLFAFFAGKNVIRFIPALNVSKQSIDEAIDILHTTLKELKQEQTKSVPLLARSETPVFDELLRHAIGGR